MIALMALLAFQMPSYHIVIVKNGMTAVLVDDMTQDECSKRVKTFKKDVHARCVLTVGQREYV